MHASHGHPRGRHSRDRQVDGYYASKRVALFACALLWLLLYVTLYSRINVAAPEVVLVDSPPARSGSGSLSRRAVATNVTGNAQLPNTNLVMHAPQTLRGEETEDDLRVWQPPEGSPEFELRRLLNRLQQPIDCRTARLFVVQSLNGAGAGAHLQHLMIKLAMAVRTNRTLVMEGGAAGRWRYALSSAASKQCDGRFSLGCEVQPPSTCTWRDVVDQGLGEIPERKRRLFAWHSDERVVFEQVGAQSSPDYSSFVHFLRSSVDHETQQHRHSRKSVHREFMESEWLQYGRPWYFAQLMGFLLRPTASFARSLRQRWADATHVFNSNAIRAGLHIRHRDKIKEHGAILPLEIYTSAAVLLSGSCDNRSCHDANFSMFVSTDDPSLARRAMELNVVSRQKVWLPSSRSMLQQELTARHHRIEAAFHEIMKAGVSASEIEQVQQQRVRLEYTELIDMARNRGVSLAVQYVSFGGGRSQVNPGNEDCDEPECVRAKRLPALGRASGGMLSDVFADLFTLAQMPLLVTTSSSNFGCTAVLLSAFVRAIIQAEKGGPTGGWAVRNERLKGMLPEEIAPLYTWPPDSLSMDGSCCAYFCVASGA